MAEQKKILVLESEKLLAAGIFSLLASHPEFDVAQTTVSSLECLGQSDNLQLEVVILDEELLATNISAVVKLANCHPKLQLIVFSLSDSKVHIFDKKTVEVSKVSDFLELFECLSD